VLAPHERGDPRMKLSHTAALLFALVITVVAAMPAHATAVWTNGNQKISAIIWRPGYHGFYVENGTFHDPPACRTPTPLYLIEPTTEQGVVLANRLFGMIMSAMAQGKTLYVVVDGCQGNIPQLTGLQVNN